MARRLMAWSVTAVSVVWIGAAAWMQFENRVDPELAEFRQLQFEQKLKDCRGRFSERYDCKSALLREQSQKDVYLWAERLGITFGPPIVLALIFTLIASRQEKRREKERAQARLKRMEKEAEAARERAIEEGRRRMEETRRRAGQASQSPENDAGNLSSDTGKTV